MHTHVHGTSGVAMVTETAKYIVLLVKEFFD